jgi:hypothetical protein
MPSGLSTLAKIVRPKLKALPASALEVLVAGDRQMTAVAAGKPPVGEGCHRPKLVVRGAVRTPNYGHGHGNIHPARLFRL